MAKLKILKDPVTGESFYPYTHEKAITDDNGNEVIARIKNDIAANTSNITKNANDIKTLQEDLSSVGQQADSNKEKIAELNDKKINKFYASNLGKTNLSDSDKGKIQDMVICGRSKQVQTIGYNLCDGLIEKGNINADTMENVKADDRFRLINYINNPAASYLYVEYDRVFNEMSIYGRCKKKDGSSTATKFVRISKKDNVEKYKIVLAEETEKFKFVFVSTELVDDTTPAFVKRIMVSVDDVPYEPYTGGIPSPNPDYPQEIKSVVNPTVKVCGKNLLKPTLKTTIKSGITCTSNGDGTYTLNGTATEVTNFKFGNVSLIEGKKYKLLGFVGTGILNVFAIYINNGTGGYPNDIGEGVIFTAKLTNVYVSITIPSGQTINNLVFKPMVTTDLNATYDDFEPYKVQTATLPYTLNAIPVTSGGNVTIDGQQYIADYVDIENKKLVRRIKTINSPTFEDYIADSAYGQFCPLTLNDKGVESIEVTVYTRKFKGISANKITTTDGYRIYCGNNGDKIFIRFPIGEFHKYNEIVSIFSNEEIIYQLATPTEIGLTDEEVQAFKDLATYYTTTNVFVTSDQLDGYTTFNYPISMAKGWNYVKQQLNDNRDYIYDMDLQSSEAYVNSEYAVTLTELEV